MKSRLSQQLRAIEIQRPTARALHVVSHPKCGRTWLRVMLDDLDVEARYTHDASGFEDHTSIATLDPDKEKYAADPVLLMVRDVRDIAVSGYFQVRHRLRLPRADSMSLSDFIRDPYYGVEKTIRFYLQWFAAATTMPKLAIVRYEDLHSDAARALAAIVRFAGRRISSPIVENVAARRSFAHMRSLEASGGFAARYGNALAPTDPADPQSYKVRRGVVGGYVDDLTEDDIRYCEDMIAEADYLAQLERALRLRSVLLFQPTAT